MLLRLYPREYRAIFGEEMRRVVEEAMADRSRGGELRIAAFIATEITALIAGATAQWAAKLSSPDRYANCYRRLQAGGGGHAVSDELKEAEARVNLLVSRMVHAIAHHDFPGARMYFHQERLARENLRLLRERRNGPRRG
jgi:hypothetical protein